MSFVKHSTVEFEVVKKEGDEVALPSWVGLDQPTKDTEDKETEDKDGN